MTCADGDQFCPINYNGNLVAWRKRKLDNAEHFGTSIAHFDHGRFVVSDGREIELADLDVAVSNGQNIPDDF